MKFVFVVAALICIIFGNAYSASLANKTLRPFVPTTELVCKDGKGPLLEGEGSPFPCADECPGGFECEHPLKGEVLGICCPNLEVLYDLYGKNSSEDELPAASTPNPLSTILNTKEVREVHKFDDSWQETSEVPEVVSALTETMKPENADFEKVSPSPDSHLLMYLKEKELRLSRGKLPVHRAALNTDSYSNPINPFNPANTKEQETVVPFFKQQQQHPNQTTTITPFSCKRQKYEAECVNNGKKRTQIVLRWFAKNGECCSYPYGFCPGTTVKEDQTLRTKEECEMFCLSNAAEIEKSFENSNGSSSIEAIKEPSVSIESVSPADIELPTIPESMASASEPIAPVAAERLSGPLPPTPSPKFPTLANPIQGEVTKENNNNQQEEQQLEEVFPPGYGPEIDEDNKTRVILHSEIQEPISIAPPNAESDAHAKDLIFEMSNHREQQEHQPIINNEKENVLVAKVENSQNSQQEEIATFTTSAIPAKVENENSENMQNQKSDLNVLKKAQQIDGLKRTKVAEKLGPKKSCQKLLPYRSMCPRTGMPSQFTLRWYVKAGMCCAYPFGYCHGDSVFEEEAIKTKQECEEICLGRVDSEKPYHRF